MDKMKSRQVILAGIIFVTIFSLVVSILMIDQVKAQCPATQGTPGCPPIQTSPMQYTPMSSPCYPSVQKCPPTGVTPFGQTQQQYRFSSQVSAEAQTQAERYQFRINNPVQTNMNVADSIMNIRELSSLAKLLQDTGTISNLSTGTFTVFAATNDAFDRLPPIPWKKLQSSENRSQLNRIASYQIVPGTISLVGNDGAGREFKSLNGEVIQIRKVNGLNYAEYAIVTCAYKATNGWIYLTDSVLIPPPGNMPTNQGRINP
jgi:uncharacterized surface protein with fasciclin (FAS1) repeats